MPWYRMRSRISAYSYSNAALSFIDFADNQVLWKCIIVNVSRSARRCGVSRCPAIGHVVRSWCCVTMTVGYRSPVDAIRSAEFIGTTLAGTMLQEVGVSVTWRYDDGWCCYLSASAQRLAESATIAIWHEIVEDGINSATDKIQDACMEDKHILGLYSNVQTRATLSTIRECTTNGWKQGTGNCTENNRKLK